MNNTFVSLSVASVKALPWLRIAVTIALLCLALFAPNVAHACDLSHGGCGG